MHDLQTFFSYLTLPFYFVDCLFCCPEIFKFVVVQLVDFLFDVVCTVGVISKKNHCQDKCTGAPSLFSFSFMVSGFCLII